MRLHNAQTSETNAVVLVVGWFVIESIWSIDTSALVRNEQQAKSYSVFGLTQKKEATNSRKEKSRHQVQGFALLNQPIYEFLPLYLEPMSQ